MVYLASTNLLEFCYGYVSDSLFELT